MTDLPQITSTSPISGVKSRVLRHKGMMIGSTIVVLVVLIAILAPLIAPHDPYHQDLLNRLKPQFGTHVEPGSIYLAQTIWDEIIFLG